MYGSKFSFLLLFLIAWGVAVNALLTLGPFMQGVPWMRLALRVSAAHCSRGLISVRWAGCVVGPFNVKTHFLQLEEMFSLLLSFFSLHVLVLLVPFSLLFSLLPAFRAISSSLSFHPSLNFYLSSF